MPKRREAQENKPNEVWGVSNPCEEKKEKKKRGGGCQWDGLRRTGRVDQREAQTTAKNTDCGDGEIR